MSRPRSVALKPKKAGALWRGRLERREAKTLGWVHLSQSRGLLGSSDRPCPLIRALLLRAVPFGQ